MPENERLSLLNESRAWPFVEARKVQERWRRNPDRVVTFQTGYGPSGLPHIGTWGEVFRTTLVRQAFSRLEPEAQTRLIVFSDDLDGLRKIPANLPQPALLEPHLDKPLSQIPDPYQQAESFAAYNNQRLCRFLERYGFDYQFISASQFYHSGAFDPTLLLVAHHYEKICSIVLPTLGAERQQTYSPFLPICPKTGRVLYAKVETVDPDNDRLIYQHPEWGETITRFTGGHCKLQWKADWAMRWHQLHVDYEMSGKDLSESVALAIRLCRAVGGQPPVSFTYELNLDQTGQKISKSKGNGLALSTWLDYAPKESLAYFMYRRPTAAKKIGLGLLVKETDDYLKHLADYDQLEATQQLESPIYHVHAGQAPAHPKIAYSLLTYLAALSVQATGDGALLRQMLVHQGLDPAESDLLSRLCECALRYAHDILLPNQQIQSPERSEDRQAIADLAQALAQVAEPISAHDLQTLVFTVGKNHGYTKMNLWFGLLYRLLFGTEAGPRLGSFFAVYGASAAATLIQNRLALSAPLPNCAKNA